MKKLLLLFLTLATLLTGCEKENEKSKDHEELLTYDKLIKSATVSIMGEDYMEYNFRYDMNDRLINMDIQINDSYYDKPIRMNCTYEYTESKVSVNVVGDDAYGDLNNDYVAEYMFDAEGTPYSCKREGNVETQMFHLGTRESYIYENGYIYKRHVMGVENYDPSTSFSVEYEWKERNLQKMLYNMLDKEDYMEFRYTYDNRVDKSNLDLIKLMYYLNYYRGGHYTADKSTFKGMSSQNLIKTHTIFAGTEEAETMNFDYRLDSDGYVMEVTTTMGGSPYMVMSIEYK